MGRRRSSSAMGRVDTRPCRELGASVLEDMQISAIRMTRGTDSQAQENKR